jgi:hypothetical protein
LSEEAGFILEFNFGSAGKGVGSEGFYVGFLSELVGVDSVELRGVVLEVTGRFLLVEAVDVKEVIILDLEGRLFFLIENVKVILMRLCHGDS